MYFVYQENTLFYSIIFFFIFGVTKKLTLSDSFQEVGKVKVKTINTNKAYEGNIKEKKFYFIFFQFFFLEHSNSV